MRMADFFVMEPKRSLKRKCNKLWLKMDIPSGEIYLWMIQTGCGESIAVADKAIYSTIHDHMVSAEITIDELQNTEVSNTKV